jgi:hypothetical protein
LRIGWVTVVSAGRTARPSGMPSKPTTATSSGTRTPRRSSTSSPPMAIWSFAYTSACGSGPRSTSRWVAARPSAWV